MQELKAADIEQVFILPEKVDGTPPQKLNCYTDGGLINPQIQRWPLGGAEVW